MIVFQNIGSLITIKSDRAIEVRISKLLIKDNNLNVDFERKDRIIALFAILDSKLILSESFFSNNFVVNAYAIDYASTGAVRGGITS